MELQLSRLEFHLLVNLYLAHIDRDPDDDERSQQFREEIGYKLAVFLNDTPPGAIVTISTPSKE